MAQPTNQITRPDTPLPGMVATVRNQRGVRVGERPFGGTDGSLDRVEIDFNDGATPRSEELPWERELHCHLVAPSKLPQVDCSDPMRESRKHLPPSASRVFGVFADAARQRVR